MRALVIGGGIGGLATAIALTHQGIETHVFERAPELKEVGAGITLWANAIKALDKLGVGAMLRQISLPDLNGGISDSSGKMLSKAATGELEKRFGAPTLMMHRADLLNVLRGAVDPDMIYLNVQCVGFEGDDKAITAKFSDGRQMDADVLIGADGVRSVVRAQMLPQVQPRYVGYTAWRAAVTFPHVQVGDHWGETWGRGTRFGIAPLKNGQVYWYATENAIEGKGVPQGQTKQHLLNLFSRWHEPIRALIEGTDESKILHNDIYDLAPLPRWTEGRVALLGDAAHATTPNMGQGACIALEDAVVMGQCLRPNVDVVTALREYEGKRMARANKIVAMSRQIGVMGQLENPLACFLRNTAVRLMPKSMTLKRLEEAAGYEV